MTEIVMQGPFVKMDVLAAVQAINPGGVLYKLMGGYVPLGL